MTNLIKCESYFFNPPDNQIYCAVLYTYKGRSKQIIINHRNRIVVKNKTVNEAFPDYVPIGVYDYDELLKLTITADTANTSYPNHFKNNFKKSRSKFMKEKEQLEKSKHRTFPYRHQPAFNCADHLTKEISKSGGIMTWNKKSHDFKMIQDEDVQELLEATGHQVRIRKESLILIVSPEIVKKEHIQEKMKQIE